MPAPKLPSMFRNVRTKPRQFSMRSPHYDQRKEKWGKRKAQLDADFSKDDPQAPGRLSFRGKRPSSDERRKVQVRRLLRTVIAMIGLVYLSVKLAEWLVK